MAERSQRQWTGDTILAFLRDHLSELQAMGVRRIGVFGSYARGEHRPQSDIDFLFAMDQMTWAGWMDVWNYLEDSFGLTVDLVPEKDLRPEIAPQVMAEVRYVEGL